MLNGRPHGITNVLALQISPSVICSAQCAHFSSTTRSDCTRSHSEKQTQGAPSLFMEFKGRTGQKRSRCSATLDYDEESDSFRLRVDDGENLEFWLEIAIPQIKLDEAREQALAEKYESDGVVTLEK